MDLNNVGKVREFRRAGRSDKLNRMIEEAQLKIEEQISQAFGAFQHNSVGSGFKVTNRAIEDNEYNRGVAFDGRIATEWRCHDGKRHSSSAKQSS